MEDQSQEPESLGDVTQLLRAVAAGRAEAKNELFEVIYDELRRTAGRMMGRQPDGHTLQATALVNEVYVRLFHTTGADWTDRRHFLVTASMAMRQLLVDHARKKAASKRAGTRIPLQDHLLLAEFDDRSMGVEALHEALAKLASIKPEMARAIELRFFGNVSMEETAKILGIPMRSFERRWAMTRAWLYGELL